MDFFSTLLKKEGQVRYLLSSQDKKAGINFGEIVSNRWAQIGIAAVLLFVGFYARVTKLPYTGLNSQEIFNYLWAKGPFFSQLVHEIQPPLFPLLSKPLLGLGIEFGPRFLSVIAGMIFCFLLWRISTKAFGVGVGMLTLLFAVISPQLIWLSRVAVGYQLFVMFTALALWALVSFVEKQSKWSGAVFVLALSASLYTFHYALYLFAFCILYSLIVFRSDRQLGKKLLLLSGLVLVSYIPMIVQFALNIDRITSVAAGIGWEAGPWQFVRRMMMLFVGFSPAAGINLAGRIGGIRIVGTIILVVIATTIFFFGIISGIRRNRGEPSIGFLLGFFAFCAGTAILVHWVFNVPIEDQYFAFLMIVTLPIISAACLFPKRKIFAGILILFFVWSNFLVVRSYANVFAEDLRDAVRWIDRRAGKGALVATFEFYIADAYLVYGRKNLETAGLPVELKNRDRMYREQNISILPSDGPAFKELVSKYGEVFLMTTAAQAGGSGRGLGQLNVWLNDSGFVLRDLSTFKGIATSRFVKTKKEKLTEPPL